MISMWILLIIIAICAVIMFVAVQPINGDTSISAILVPLFIILALVSWIGYGACHRQVESVELLPIITISYPNGQSEQVSEMPDKNYVNLTKTEVVIYDPNSYKYELTTYSDTGCWISWPEYTTGKIIFVKK